MALAAASRVAAVAATNVRARILERKDWETLVPPAVDRIVKELDGVGRVRSMISKDTEA